ncbi:MULTISPECIES: ABC transporter permease [unclassified Brenneria]|uniref:ABC transporter permease n=1 Tax=unclassified Brenneria TaxID=2634434 RepID=UPI0029C5F658|nr:MULTISPECIES: ABC transporter permease [unclassified Brenneria]MDX5627463.1 ABC transporter permease [Brenneria sp. L3-3Z]MDX5694381.1 ABC transporter permease [Brenneria sp. L4-2C]
MTTASEIAPTGWRSRLSRWRFVTLSGAAILLLITLAALSAGLIWPAGPWVQVAEPLIPPFVRADLPLGTDGLGRNVAAMLVYGARVSLLIGTASTAAATLLGILIGAVAGYVRGVVDDLLMRFTEIFQTIPSFMFVIVLMVIFTPTVYTITLAIAIVSWPPAARLVRGEFMTLSKREFVQSCRLIGMHPARIIFTEILPNCLSSVVVIASVMVASAVLIEAGLSFLGLGDPNIVSWGGMVAQGKPMIRSAAYLSIVPGLAIFVLVLCINIVGEGLNDRLNPRLRRR